MVQKSRCQAFDRDSQSGSSSSSSSSSSRTLHSSSSSSNRYLSSSKLLAPSAKGSMQKQLQQWGHEKEIMFRHSLGILKEQIIHAKETVKGANSLAQEIGQLVTFNVTLQIPLSYLSLNTRKIGFMCEPAILVKQKNSGSQIWPLDKLDNKITGMQEIYRRYKGNNGLAMDQSLLVVADPFDDPNDSQSLVGVASIFLQCLFHEVELDHYVPIISQQGEIAGKLHVQISVLEGTLLTQDTDTTASGHDCPVQHGGHLIIRLCIMEAQGLPEALFNSLFCQYHFWGDTEETVVPAEETETLTHRDSHTADFVFNHEQYMQVPVTKAFIEHCLHGALSIEVWGHRRKQHDMGSITLDTSYLKTNHVTNQWVDVVKKIELWVEIHESNNQGVYRAVEVTPKTDVPCAGVMQLREGNSRQVLVRVCPVANSGTLPLICESISAVAVGCVCLKSYHQKGLNSYQKEDLAVLRDHWLKSLIRRKNYFDEQIQMLTKKRDKSEVESERERALIRQRILLMEEHNSVLFPSRGSNIPGAPARWTPPPNMEEHSPVLFLDLTSEDIYTSNSKVGLQAVGINSLLQREQSTEYTDLPIIKNFVEKNNVCAVASWDTSDLNKATTTNERVYMILKVVVRLSHPVTMDLVLRKRICININRKQSLSSFTSIFKNRIIHQNHFYGNGVIYEIVSNLPKSLEDLEEMETLGPVAASQEEKVSSVDGETYLERYMRAVAAIDRTLIMDRLRQEVAVKEMLANLGCCNSGPVSTLCQSFDDENTDQYIDPQRCCDLDLDVFENDDDDQHCDLYQSQQSCTFPLVITPSSTTESLLEAQTKGHPASLTSSGYLSETVSTMTLSVEDCASITSLNGSGDHSHLQDREHSHLQDRDHSHLQDREHSHLQDRDHSHFQDRDHSHLQDIEHSHLQGREHSHLQDIEHSHLQEREHSHLQDREHSHLQDNLHCGINHELDENHNEAAGNSQASTEIYRPERVFSVAEKSKSSIRRNSENPDLNTDLQESSCFTENISEIGIKNAVTSQKDTTNPLCSFDNSLDDNKGNKREDKPKDCGLLISFNASANVKDKLKGMEKKCTKTADFSRHSLSKTNSLDVKKQTPTLQSNQNDQKQKVAMNKYCADPLKSKYLHGKNNIIKTSTMMSTSSSSLSSSTSQTGKMKIQRSKSLQVYENQKGVGRRKEMQPSTESILMGDLAKQKILSQRLHEKDGRVKTGERLNKHSSGREYSSSDVRQFQTGTGPTNYKQSLDGTRSWVFP